MGNPLSCRHGLTKLPDADIWLDDATGKAFRADCSRAPEFDGPPAVPANAGPAVLVNGGKSCTDPLCTCHASMHGCLRCGCMRVSASRSAAPAALDRAYLLAVLVSEYAETGRVVTHLGPKADRLRRDGKRFALLAVAARVGLADAFRAEMQRMDAAARAKAGGA